MEAIFLQILNMSISASYVILFVLLVRLLLKRAPRAMMFILWAVVLFRLLCPLSFESAFSFMRVNPVTVRQDIGFEAQPRISSGVQVIDNAVNTILPPATPMNSANPLQIWIFIGTCVWAIGLVVLLLIAVWSSIKLAIRLRGSKQIQSDIFISDKIDTAFVFGLIPRIYLPQGIAEHEVRYIIMHERAHIRRLDFIIKPLFFFAVSLHWFNPLVWLAFAAISRDMEQACDEYVLRRMGNGVKKDYSRSLLRLESRHLYVSPLAFSEKFAKRRIKHVLNYKRPAFWISAVACVIALVGCVGLASNPATTEPTQTTEQTLTQSTQPIQPKPSPTSNTVNDFAQSYINEEMTTSFIKFTDSKITKLEKLATLENFPIPVELWTLEYRLKPSDLEIAIRALDRPFEDGWVTEERTSFGKPIILVKNDNGKLSYLGCMGTINTNLAYAPGQRIAAREYLESIGWLKRETYEGEHAIIASTMSNGDAVHMLLSQPYGTGYAWCVERSLDTNGNLYYAVPENEIDEPEAANGLWISPVRSNPMEAAKAFFRSESGFGQWPAKDSDFYEWEPPNSNILESFYEVPSSSYFGRMADFDTVEGTFKLYRHPNYPDLYDSYKLSDNAIYAFLPDFTRGIVNREEVTLDEFIEHMDKDNILAWARSGRVEILFSLKK